MKDDNPLRDLGLDIVGGSILCLAVIGILVGIRAAPVVSIALLIIPCIALAALIVRASGNLRGRPRRIQDWVKDLAFAIGIVAAGIGTVLVFCDCI